MRVIRYITVAATALMSLMNLPFAFTDVTASKPVAWLVTVLGVVGLVAAVALLRNVSWGVWAVLAVGVVNLVGAIVAMAQRQEGAVIGLVVSTVITALAGVLAASAARRQPQPA